MFKTAIVVPAAPHYPDEYGMECVWFGRIDRAIKLARARDAPLIIVGDGNGGLDNQLFEQRARAHGLTRVYVGDNQGETNTRGDMRAAARVLQDHPDLQDINWLIYATCWYHAARAYAELSNAVDEAMPFRLFRSGRLFLGIRPSLVSYPREETRRMMKRLWGELRGTWHAIRRRVGSHPYMSWGEFATLGKPVFNQSYDECPTPTPIRTANDRW